MQALPTRVSEFSKEREWGMNDMSQRKLVREIRELYLPANYANGANMNLFIRIIRVIRGQNSFSRPFAYFAG
jgi:hypothetical protein